MQALHDLTAIMDYLIDNDYQVGGVHFICNDYDDFIDDMCISFDEQYKIIVSNCFKNDGMVLFALFEISCKELLSETVISLGFIPIYNFSLERISLDTEKTVFHNIPIKSKHWKLIKHDLIYN